MRNNTKRKTNKQKQHTKKHHATTKQTASAPLVGLTGRWRRSGRFGWPGGRLYGRWADVVLRSVGLVFWCRFNGFLMAFCDFSVLSFGAFGFGAPGFGLGLGFFAVSFEQFLMVFCGFWGIFVLFGFGAPANVLISVPFLVCCFSQLLFEAGGLDFELAEKPTLAENVDIGYSRNSKFVAAGLVGSCAWGVGKGWEAVGGVADGFGDGERTN